MAIYFVDFPIFPYKNSDFPVRYVKLPEGINHIIPVNRLY